MKNASRLAVSLSILSCFLASPDAGWALGPHEVALLVNRRSPESLEIANTYARLRGIPPENIVTLDLPDSVLQPAASLSPEQFQKTIWDPARTALAARQIDQQILAWVYSSDFPFQISTVPAPVSLHGMTFAKNALQIQSMTNAQGPSVVVFPSSPLFRGPVQPGGPTGPPVSLETQRDALGAAMPLPAMSLAHTGSRGLTRQEVMLSLNRSALSDGSRPTGRVYFVKTTDAARSGPREWQFEPAASELRDLGIPAEVTSVFPTGATEVVGLMLGMESPPVATVGSFAPGSMAEHLTSWAGMFNSAAQVKLTEWLRAGASTSGGTITEPLALWPKFPHARYFTHLAYGSTTIESWYQALAMPQQQILIGDPLSKPYAPRFEVELTHLQDGTEAGSYIFVGRIIPETLATEAEYVFLLDGRAVTPRIPKPGVRWKASDLTPGFHQVRLVAYLKNTVRHQAFAEVSFRVESAERGIELVEPAPGSKLDARRGWSVRMAPLGEPLRIALYAQGREVAQIKGSAPSLSVNPEWIGAGPVLLQPVAFYGDPAAPVEVRGTPVPVILENRNTPPDIRRIARVETDEGPALRPSVTDAEEDEVHIRWFEAFAAAAGDTVELPPAAVLSGGELKPDSNALIFRPGVSNRYDTCVFPDRIARELVADLYLDPGPSGAVAASFAGLIFGCKGTNDFGFFGVDGASSSWTMGFAGESGIRPSVQRGAPIRTRTWYRLSVRLTDSGRIEGRVNDQLVCVLDASAARWNAGPGGFLAGLQPARFRRIARAGSSLDSDLLESDRAASSGPRRVFWIRAEDPFSATWKAIP
jgi:hypothetical protein